MHPRQTLTDLFSAFIQFEAEQFSRWLVDPRLRRNMAHCLARSPQESEAFWALYWHRCWSQHSAPLATEHLLAYMQDACYWAAYQAAQRFTSTQYGLSDCFQLAIADLNTVLRGYDVARGASLKTYAAIAFPSLLRDRLRQQQEVHICSDWTLLRKVSKKRLGEALHQAGLSAEAIAQYQGVWLWFKTLYVPNTLQQRVPVPDAATWEAVVAAYRQDSQMTLEPTTARQWMTRAAIALRQYLYPAVASLNMPHSGRDSGELQDDLTDVDEESLLATLIAEEERQQRASQRQQVQTVLRQAIAQLEPSSQALIQLYYRDGLTQQQMMEHLNLSQSTVSRRLTKARESLLRALVQWSQTTLNSPIHPSLIKGMGDALDDWLKTSYRSLEPLSTPDSLTEQPR